MTASSELAASSTHLTSASSPFTAAAYSEDRKLHLLVAASGSVATIKLPLILRKLSEHRDISIRVILTSTASRFLNGSTHEQPPVSSLSSIPHVHGVYTDEDEWEPAWTRGAPVLHIELRKWADVMLVAPLDANTLAKMAHGLADNLLTSVLRAWDPEGQWNPPGREGEPKTLFLAPAMNTAMWLHPVTKRQIRVLEEEWALPAIRDGKATTRPWAEVLRPAEKGLACGDVGVGAMMEWSQVVDIVKRELVHL